MGEVVNEKCQIFTPPNYVHELLNMVDYNSNIIGKTILENSCGDGNILIEIVKRYIEDSLRHGLSNESIKIGLERDIYAYEIDAMYYKTCLNKLDCMAFEYGISKVKWNLYNKDYLFNKSPIKFDYIVGNPPYLSYQEIDTDMRDKIRNQFNSCKVGKFDYCFAFIEKSLLQLSATGKFSYLIPGSIFKTVFGASLREKIKVHLISIKDYRNVKVFNDALVKSAIILIDKNKASKHINYVDCNNNINVMLEKSTLNNKWVFNLEQNNMGRRFGDYFKVSSTIATLCNEAFLLKPGDLNIDEFNINGLFLEKALIRKACSPKSLRYNKIQYIIFPYEVNQGNIIRLTDTFLINKYPGIYTYLANYREKLLERKRDKNSNWFEYGRSQALRLMSSKKLLISSIITNRISVYDIDKDEIPYSGLIVTKRKGSKLSLREAKQILESNSFLSYTKSIGVPLNGQSIRITSKDIENYIIEDI